MTITLEVTKREGGTASALRATGSLPAVVYGSKLETIPVAIDAKAFATVLEEAGESTIIALTGLDKPVEALIHDVAFHPVKGGVIHADFYAIDRTQAITTNIPLEFEGEAPVQKTGGSVNHILHEVEVTCRPDNLPSHLVVDVSTLIDEDAHILVSDLSVPSGVTIENEPDAVVANVAAAREEEPEPEPEAVDMSQVAVEEKGKADTEEEAA